MSNNKKKIYGGILISFIAAIVGVAVSYTLLKEDVLSTAHTLFEYFPSQFGVTPALTWQGAIYLGIFVTVVQIVSASVAFQKSFSMGWRYIAGFLLVISVPFDAWTDIVFRSNQFNGNVKIALVTTIAFYTFGSEIMQSLSWLIILSTWRHGIREAMWVASKGLNGIGSIRSEWNSINRAAHNQEQREVQSQGYDNQNQSYPRSAQHPQSVSKFVNRPSYQSAQQVENKQTTRPAPKPILRPAPAVPQSNLTITEPTYHPVSYPENNGSAPWDVAEEG